MKLIKLVLLSLANVSVLVDCSSTRPIGDAALGVSGAYLAHQLSDGSPGATVSATAGGVLLSGELLLRRQEASRKAIRHRLRQGQERRRETTVLALRVHAAAAQPGQQRPPLPRSTAGTAH